MPYRHGMRLRIFFLLEIKLLMSLVATVDAMALTMTVLSWKRRIHDGLPTGF